MIPKKLNFVIGGAQKGGTCTLDKLFRMHPEIQMATKKEIHFFDDESRDWTSSDYSVLNSHFTGEGSCIRGEATPITFYWKPAIRRIRDHNPAMKFILILRDPVSRAYSNWKMEWAAGRERMLFADAIRSGRARVCAGAETEGLHRYLSYVERGFYGEQLNYVLERFPEKNIHCEIFEEFFADRSAGLGRLSSFLGIAQFADALPDVHAYKAAEIEYPSTLTQEDAHYLAGLYRGDTAELEKMLGRSIPAWRRR